MCVYSRSFPFDVVVRIWDIFIAEGWTIVYQVALALLKLNESKIISFEIPFLILSNNIYYVLEEIVGQEFEAVHTLISNINTSVWK